MNKHEHERLSAAMKLYEQTFGDTFPTFPMRSRSYDELIDIMNKCVSEKKDVYEMGHLPVDDGEIFY